MGNGIRSKFRPFLRLPVVPDQVWQVYGADAQPDPIWATGTPRRDIPDRATFDNIGHRDDVPGLIGVREVKFLIAAPLTPTPQLYFMDANSTALHFHFARGYLGFEQDASVFNRVTYFTDNRQFLAGSVLAYDNFIRPDGAQGLYALEFWATDPVSAEFVALTYGMIEQAMPFAAKVLAYHPSGDVQERILADDADAFAAHGIRTISTTELFDGVAYNPLNLGEAYGVLRVVSGGDPRPPSATDIVIYDTLPNDLPIVAGVITSAPQTPLSHVNLRAQQNGIANAYLRDGADNPVLRDHIGATVRLVVGADRIVVTPISTADMHAANEARRPAETQTPARDLGPRGIVALDDLQWIDVDAFGAKATNLAELRRVIDPQFVPDGFAVPFSYYHDFMVANGLYDVLAALLENPDLRDDVLRGDMLKAFRKAIKSAPMTTPMRDQLDLMHKAFPVGTTPRCRSSANNEDLVGFTGAGLYDSYTHRLDEGHIEKSIKQVWASLWTLRAFNERDFYRIDQRSAAMGVLVHPNFDDERVNGVALTRNFYFPAFEGYYINAQIGEDMVTNPDGQASAEEVLVIDNIDAASTHAYEAIYVRRSSRVAAGDTVLSRDDLMLLVAQLGKIQRHFERLYRREADDSFAMDVEFKIDRDGQLAIKQARPWTS